MCRLDVSIKDWLDPQWELIEAGLQSQTEAETGRRREVQKEPHGSLWPLWLHAGDSSTQRALNGQNRLGTKFQLRAQSPGD
jgi:hypothetical protein